MATEQILEHAAGIHVALAPEVLGTFWGIPLTNTLLTSWIVMAILMVVGIVVGLSIKLMPGRFQTLLEWLTGGVYDFATETLENRSIARRYLPLMLTLFLFIFTSNILEFTPGIGSIGLFHGDEFTALFRSVNTDLNVTFALSVIAVVAIEIAGIVAVGAWRYAGKFFNFTSPVNFIVGIIEFVSEMSRFISFAFRLFGNVFAGEVLIAVIGFFVPYFLPVPVMAFEVFIGFVQAAVFPLLMLFFLKMAIAEPHEQH